MSTKILHVFGTAEARNNWLKKCAFLSPTVTVFTNGVGRKDGLMLIQFRDGTELYSVVVDSASSAQRLMGHEYSAVFEHASFVRPVWWEDFIKPKVRL